MPKIFFILFLALTGATHAQTSTRNRDVLVPTESQIALPYNYAAENQRVNREENNMEYNRRIAQATEDTADWTLGAVLFAAAAFLISVLAFRVSSKESRHELMAYVYPSKIEIRGVKDWTTNIGGQRVDGLDVNNVSPHIEVLITFKNTGQTPAFDFQHMGSAFAQRPNYSTSKNLVKWWKEPGKIDFLSSATIPPNQEVTVVVLTRPIKAMRKAAFINGTNYLFLEGITRYRSLGRIIRSDYRYLRMNSLIALDSGTGIEFDKGTGILTCECGNKTTDRWGLYVSSKQYLKSLRFGNRT